MSNRRTAVFQYVISSSKGLLFASTVGGVLLCFSITGCLRGVMEQSGTSTPQAIATAPPASPSLGTSSDVPTGVSFKNVAKIPITYVGGIVSGDFNEDGKDDLLISYVIGSKLVLFLNKGDGSFGPPIYLTPNESAHYVGPQMTVGDFNGDGKLDILVPWYQGVAPYANGISLLVGNGDGTFQSGRILTGVPAGPPTIADFNRDGILDLAVIGGDIGPLSILLGNKNDLFGTTENFAGPVLRLAVGDFNKDGIPDIAFTYQLSNNISVLLGKGDGTFEKRDLALSAASGATPQYIALADFNKDGNLDILTANSNSKQNLSLWLGNGDGSFQSAKSFEAKDLMHFGLPFSLTDIDGDGNLDIVVADVSQFETRGFSPLSVLLGNGDGTFQPQRSFDDLPLGMSTLGDFNGDHKPDIATLTKDGIAIIINTTR